MRREDDTICEGDDTVRRADDTADSANDTVDAVDDTVFSEDETANAVRKWLRIWCGIVVGGEKPVMVKSKRDCGGL